MTGYERDDIERVLLTEEQIGERVAVLAAQISAHYAGKPLVLVGILKGSFIFLADLSRRLTIPHRIEFMAVSSYGDKGAVGGVVRTLLDLRGSVYQQHLLIVEDIVDTGLTLRYLIDLLRTREVASVQSCVLLSKPSCRQVEVPVEFLGFEIPDVWVVGYGLDFAERYRTLPYIGVIRPRDEG